MIGCRLPPEKLIEGRGFLAATAAIYYVELSSLLYRLSDVSRCIGSAMGNCASKKNKRPSGSNRVVLFLGLDGSGTTTMLYQLLLGRHLQTIPTLGNNHETITADGMELDCWDIGGLEKMRHLWVQYSQEADGIVFVVDSSDPGRFDLAAKELNKIYVKTPNEDDEEDPAGDEDAHPPKRMESRHMPMEDVPLLLLASKQDVEGAEGPKEVAGAVRLSSLPCKHFNVIPCSAIDLPSLQAGIRWMTDLFKAQNSGTAPPTSPASSG